MYVGIAGGDFATDPANITATIHETSGLAILRLSPAVQISFHNKFAHDLMQEASGTGEDGIDAIILQLEKIREFIRVPEGCNYVAIGRTDETPDYYCEGEAEWNDGWTFTCGHIQ